MSRPAPACKGDRRFTSNASVDVAEAVTICRTCEDRVCRPILADILASPTDRTHVEGVWDGRYYSAGTTGKWRAA